MMKMINCYKILAGKPKKKRAFGRLRRRWEENIKWILWKWGGRLWTGFIWLRIETAVGVL
jgi:hypothetical protein